MGIDVVSIDKIITVSSSLASSQIADYTAFHMAFGQTCASHRLVHIDKPRIRSQLHDIFPLWLI